MSPADFIKELGLLPHPEGGFYKEVYRSGESFNPAGFEGERNYLTSIYFLLEKGVVSHFHSIQSDELWYYHGGAPCRVHQISREGKYSCFDLGLDIANGEKPFSWVPKGVIFGAESLGEFSLVSCAVAPGFDFSDFDLKTTSALQGLHPEYSDLISRFTKEKYR